MRQPARRRGTVIHEWVTSPCTCASGQTVIYTTSHGSIRGGEGALERASLARCWPRGAGQRPTAEKREPSTPWEGKVREKRVTPGKVTASDNTRRGARYRALNQGEDEPHRTATSVARSGCQTYPRHAVPRHVLPTRPNDQPGSHRVGFGLTCRQPSTVRGANSQPTPPLADGPKPHPRPTLLSSYLAQSPNPPRPTARPL